MSESIRILKELIKLNSENPPGITRENILWIKKWADENKIRSEIHWLDEFKGNIVLSYGEKKYTIVLCGHLDTVPAGERKNWQNDPFEPMELDNYILGRGSADMKGGVAACLGALKKIKETIPEDQMKFKILFLGTSDEEVGLGGAKAAISRGLMEFAVFLIVTEPTSLKIGIIEKGVLWLKILCHGQSAHGSTPEKGVNAIENLIKIFPILYSELPNLENEILGTSTLNIGLIQGGTSANVVPEKAEIHCDYRLIPPINPNEFATQIHEKISEFSKGKNVRFETIIMQTMPTVSTSVDNLFVKKLMEMTNNKTPIGLNYATDAAILAKEVPFVIFGPGDPKAIHVTNERVSIKEVEYTEKILVKFLNAILKEN
ncbi:MAG: M20 family peptidase [Candidatus Heimdallarchaeota archaeon]|nr:M20 family peptidase [Candidatus Heimdallarchaeota archaeon]